ncbi:hypothetical protein ABG79_00662 [Caloramator mitchellensis]|uniref:Methyltransferase domain protein n=1 Tax=Caloramator mitchellensis TaxID=908809 RepID=A0A0R3K225_CALMK|nr:methyltransferase domain-containing protein [Caloramator mitchellensis]KRQ87324.1 hypothetical protein ABG79_00662 [Caloramator mitchellensis]
MGDKCFILDLSRKRFEGDILDISYEGNTAISEIINNDYQKDFYKLKRLDNNLGKFDYVIFFLSLNKYKRNAKKLIRSIKGNLKEDGKVVIWDIDYKRLKPFERINIKIINKNNRIKTLDEEFRHSLFTLECRDIIELLQREGFEILNKNDDSIIFYIEAKNAEEANENTVSST